MMIKIFTANGDGKIVLTPKELKEILDEAYWEGYRNNRSNITYTTPNVPPYIYCTSSSGISANSITISSNTTATKE